MGMSNGSIPAYQFDGTDGVPVWYGVYPPWVTTVSLTALWYLFLLVYLV
jgi:hypothetical protein